MTNVEVFEKLINRFIIFKYFDILLFYNEISRSAEYWSISVIEIRIYTF